MSSNRDRNMGGFTLIEMAIVIVLMAIMVGGVAVTIGAQQRQQSARDAERQLDEIKLALIGYAASRTGKPHLPCPATADTDGNEGPRNGAGNCSQAEGMLPWVTLGVGDVDPWGSRYSYRVAPVYGNDNGFTLGDVPPGDIEVCRTAACPAAELLAIQLPAVVLSRGRNRLGAFLPTGETAAAPTDANELENDDLDSRFVSGADTDIYDDVVMWLSPHVLKQRMIQAGRLP